MAHENIQEQIESEICPSGLKHEACWWTPGDEEEEPHEPWNILNKNNQSKHVLEAAGDSGWFTNQIWDH